MDGAIVTERIIKLTLRFLDAEYRLEIEILDEKEVIAWIYRKLYDLKYKVFHSFYTEPIAEEKVLENICQWIKDNNSIRKYEAVVEVCNNDSSVNKSDYIS